MRLMQYQLGVRVGPLGVADARRRLLCVVARPGGRTRLMHGLTQVL